MTHYTETLKTALKHMISFEHYVIVEGKMHIVHSNASGASFALHDITCYIVN